MAKVSLSEHMSESPRQTDGEAPDAGPFITVSRQFGCYGFSLGLLVLDILNEQAQAGTAWKIYHKEILSKLATETNLAEELLERQRRTKPGLLANFLNSLSKDRVPSGQEIRNRVTAIIRGLAIDGHAIIIGQGGAEATRGVPRGLSVRLEAPEEWRIKQIAFREGLGETEARLRIRAMEEERKYVRKSSTPRKRNDPVFHLIYDCSEFSLAQIAQQLTYAMKLKGLV